MANKYNLPPELLKDHPCPERIPLTCELMELMEPILRAGYKRLLLGAQAKRAKVIKYKVWAFVLCDEVLDPPPTDPAAVKPALQALIERSINRSLNTHH